MLALVDTLMEYHRMDEGGTHSKNTLFSLKTLFEEIADSHRLAALQKDLAFTASFSGLDAIVCCDSSHIRQIVGNLLLRKIAVFSHFMQPLIPHRITCLANIIALMRLGLTKWHEMDHD